MALNWDLLKTKLMQLSKYLLTVHHVRGIVFGTMGNVRIKKHLLPSKISPSVVDISKEKRVTVLSIFQEPSVLSFTGVAFSRRSLSSFSGNANVY